MLATIIISLLVAVAFIAVVVSEVRKKKSGKHSCSCGGNCGGCGLCCSARDASPKS